MAAHTYYYVLKTAVGFDNKHTKLISADALSAETYRKTLYDETNVRGSQ
jgi:hypothetical protein